MNPVAQSKAFGGMCLIVFQGEGSAKDGLGLIKLKVSICTCFRLDHPGQVLIHIDLVHQGDKILSG